MRIEGDGVSVFFCWEEWRTGLITINALFLCGYVLINRIKQKVTRGGRLVTFIHQKSMIAKLQQTGWMAGRPAFWIFFACSFLIYLR